MNNKKDYLLYLVGLIPVIWIGLLITPSITKGLPSLINDFPSIMDNPFSIHFSLESIKVVFICCFIYILAIGVYMASKGNYRRSEEHGSARWGNKTEINKQYKQEPAENNKILTRNVSMGLNGKIHMRNLNTLIIGGSGAGKTRFYAKPNVMQCNTSMVILDPKGEIIKATGNLLKEKGYEIRVLDLLNMEKSHCYNPFVYIESENDVQRLVTNLFKSTTPKGAQTQDPFWDTMAASLLNALIFYLWLEAPEEEQNFPMIMEMIRAGDISEEDSETPSPLDMLFNKLEERNPEHIALRYYKGYRSGAAKTVKSIQVTLVSRLEKFNLNSLAGITQTDELDLPSLGEKKVALFALISDTDTSFNFLVSILYTQIFQQLFFLADREYGGTLPIPVHFVMDEFANVALPDDFQNILSVMRSRGVFVSIIIQNMAQLKKLFEKDWESITGNCDELLYLGGNEQSTHKYVSELLGKQTIDINTYGQSKGRTGNYTKNYQTTGRELMTPDEVRMLSNKKCILFIRGERPIIDKKYDIKKHPNINLTEDGKGESYYHGETNNAIASVSLTYDVSQDEYTKYKSIKDNYEIIFSDEIDDYFERKEMNKNETKSKKDI